MAEVKLEAVEKRFKGNRVIHDLSLTIRDRELFTLVGPSGCGKSTLLNLIAGLDEPTSGRIYFDGQLVNAIPPKDRDVAMVFQSYALYPHLNVYENLAFPLRMRKVPRGEIDRRVREVAGLLGIGDLRERRPRELSGGQRQRVALGRAIVRNPRVFLLDEPLSNLDARLRVEMRAELKRLHQTLQTTLIYVTHDQAEAMTLSDRIAVIDRGEIQQCGSPREIYDHPANRFVAGFMGTPSINLLEGKLSGAGKEVEIGDFRCALKGKACGAISHGKVLLGVRPEHLRISREPKRKSLRGKVSVVEPMGYETWVEIAWQGKRLTGKAASDFEARPGEEVFAEVDWGRIHLFDAEEGSRILFEGREEES